MLSRCSRPTRENFVGLCPVGGVGEPSNDYKHGVIESFDGGRYEGHANKMGRSRRGRGSVEALSRRTTDPKGPLYACEHLQRSRCKLGLHGNGKPERQLVQNKQEACAGSCQSQEG